MVAEDYRVQVRRDLLTYLHSVPTASGLLDHDGKTIWLPKAQSLRPGHEFLRRKVELVA